MWVKCHVINYIRIYNPRINHIYLWKIYTKSERRLTWDRQALEFDVLLREFKSSFNLFIIESLGLHDWWFLVWFGILCDVYLCLGLTFFLCFPEPPLFSHSWLGGFLFNFQQLFFCVSIFCREYTINFFVNPSLVVSSIVSFFSRQWRPRHPCLVVYQA